MSKTIARLQTPPGAGGIAVIALAGPGTQQILKRVFRPLKSHARGGAGALQLGHLLDGGRVVDETVVHVNGQIAEINIHGGGQVARTALELLAANGAAVQPARASAEESFPLAHPRWNNPAIGAEMLQALALAESSLVAAAVTQQWSSGLSELAGSLGAGPGTAEKLRQAAEGFSTMQRLLHPAEVVLAGPPNVGKSTLANALVGREVSIVHDAAGTTRDWVRELAIFDGIAVHLTDTAGIWDVGEGIAAEAVRRARRRVEKADLVLLLGGSEHPDVPAWCSRRNVLRVSAKCDISPPQRDADVAVSAVTGEGLDKLTRAVLRALDLDSFDPTSPMAFTQRQVGCLQRAARAIRQSDMSAAKEHLRSLCTGD